MPDLEALLPDVDARFERLQREARIPGVAWGVVRGATLVHAGGAGTIRDGVERRPDSDAVFRIASMTKSFTAATILLLRDEGRLRLDDPVATLVPGLAGWRPMTADSPPITIRHLLTMSSGLPTDDPWGDRQQGLALDRFAAFLASGPTLVWPSGTTFDYSNLGYGILGRVISAAAGAEYREVVRERLLVPLGMASTGYLAETVPEDRLAHGYVRRDEALVREGTDGYGALASMGGVFSTVGDLARWVAGFLDAFPARDDPEGPHLLRRSSRREMQQVQRAFPPIVHAQSPDAPATIEAGGYGYGLMVLDDAELGTTIGHAGGYPGFGSHMVWHPATGLGVIGLANLRYGPVRPVATETLAMLVRADAVPRRRPAPRQAVTAYRTTVERLIEVWDDAVADQAFAINMDLDVPRDVRRAAVAAIRRALGPFHSDPDRPVRSDSPAQLDWWLRGERGWVRIEILVTPEPSPRIQVLRLTAVGDPSATLRATAERIIALTAEADPRWPDDLPAGASLDTGGIVRALRAAGARLGALRLGLPLAGDGRNQTTMEVDGSRGRAELTIELADDGSRLGAVRLRMPERASPPEAW
jgi:serine-type D-Ala-D-Ala carboxypeptidase/endopeptidase